MRSFDSVALRQLRTRPLRAVLTGLGVMLGVGMIFGVLLLVGTIKHTFDDLINSAWGSTDLVVQGQNGTGRLPQSALDEIRSTEGVHGAGAMIGSVFTRLDRDGDAIKGASGRMFVAAYDTSEFAPYDFRMLEGRRIRSGREVMVERNWADDKGVRVGERVPVATQTGRTSLPVVGIFRFSSGLSFGGQGLAAMPIDQARGLMDIPNGYLQISISAADRSETKPLERRLQRALGSGVEVKTPQSYSDDISQQLSSLNVVLYFFSGIALFVGGFLILNSFNMTVLQRMREIGTLRTLGATRTMVIRSVLVEALVLGVVGAIAGLALGLLLAKGLIAFMATFGIPIGNLQVTPGAGVVAVVVGLIVTTVGALYPARRAGMIPPIQAVLGGPPAVRRPPLRRAAIGLALFLPGLLLGGTFWFENDSSQSALTSMLGILGTMGMFAGIAVAAPFVIIPLVRLVSAPLRRLSPTGGRLAADAAGSNPARTAATAAALTIGLSVVVVNSAMAASFLGAIEDQIDKSLAADITVRPTGQGLENPAQSVPPKVRRQIAAMPETGLVTPMRVLLLELPRTPENSQPGLLQGIDPSAYGKVDQTPIKDVSRAAALAGVARGGAIVGSSYAKAQNIHRGDRLALRGPRGSRRVPVAGVLDATDNAAGNTMQISLAAMRAVYGTTDDTQLLVKARSDDQRAALERRVDAVLDRDYPNIEQLSTAEVKDDIKSQINQQFGFFNAIVAIAVIVSLLGIINTLAMSVIERTREIGVLRALGSSRWLVRTTMLDESLLITISGAIAGIGFGALIGAVWVRGLDSIMPGISFRFPTVTVALVAFVAVLLGVLAAILPARRAARLNVIEALNYE